MRLSFPEQGFRQGIELPDYIVDFQDDEDCREGNLVGYLTGTKDK